MANVNTAEKTSKAYLAEAASGNDSRNYWPNPGQIPNYLHLHAIRLPTDYWLARCCHFVIHLLRKCDAILCITHDVQATWGPPALRILF